MLQYLEECRHWLPVPFPFDSLSKSRCFPTSSTLNPTETDRRYTSNLRTKVQLRNPP